MKYILQAAILLSISYPAYAQQMPEQLARYERIFPALNTVAGQVWTGAHVPYANVPVLDYDLGTKTEFLINYPDTPPTNYTATPYIINGKPVYKKQGELSFQFPGGQCCRNIGAIPTVTMGYAASVPAEDILRTMLHEGFHYYQQASLYKTGTDSVLTKYKRDYLRHSPRSTDYETILIAETKLLAEMMDTQPTSNGSENLKKVAALETVRKKQLPDAVSLGEDSEFLIEGTAVYVELRGMELLIGESRGLSISTETLKQLYRQYADHYGPAILRNQINLTSNARGEMTYRHALALIKILAETTPDWHAGIFPLLSDTGASQAQTEQALFRHLSEYSLARMLISAVRMSPEKAKPLAEAAVKESLSEPDIAQVREKLEIEKNISEFPLEAGWTYQMEAGQFLYAYFDYRTGRMYYGNTLENAYLSGLVKMESVDKQLLLENIAIPIVSDIYHGNIRFKDIGHKLEDANISCIDKNGEVCGTLSLHIKGLDAKIRNATMTTDYPRKTTHIKLIK